jgi:serine phosphatase RsbU (regulator of sigma subunit)
MFRTLRIQFLTILLSLGVLNLFIIYFFLSLADKKNELENISKTMHQISLLSLSDAKAINDFFTSETRRPDYFISHQSAFLELHSEYLNQLKSKGRFLQQQKAFCKTGAVVWLDSILQSANELDKLVSQTTSLIFTRGFKDYGVEGAMRKHAHILEHMPQMDMVALLMLRRHEKDYIIRNEEKYIINFNEKIDLLIQQSKDSKQTANVKQLMLTELEAYKSEFNRMVALDTQIGIKNNSALRLQIEQKLNQILDQSNVLKKQLDAFYYRTFIHIKYLSYGLFAGMLLFSVFFSFRLSKIITRRITMLSASIASFIQSGFTSQMQIESGRKKDEVSQLIHNFNTMQRKISDQLNHLEIKVAERTEEISLQKEHILAQNNKMLDSLRYAMNIQEAILPHIDYIKKTFPEHFIFYKPKDLVSGDFYWYKRIVNNNFNVSVFAVADGTGHGVPGAFMSLLGIAFLNDIVLKKQVENSADILNMLQQKIVENLAQQNNGKTINDGMDIALVIFDHQNQKVQFSGANRDLYLIRDNNLIWIKGDRMPIGKFARQNNAFTLHEHDIKLNDFIYLFTDGFADQEGGPNGRKYLRKNLREQFIKMHRENAFTQKQTLEKIHKNWKGNCDQTDDILVAGIKYLC